MNTEQTEILQRRAALHGALADVTRLRIVDLLAVSDRSATELGTALAIPSNLLAHHLKVLDSAGLLTRRRSEGDARRSYLSLNGHNEWLLRDLGAGQTQVSASRIVFVCTAAWRRVSDIPATSAGTHPGESTHHGAIATAQRHDLDLPAITPRALGPTDLTNDLIVTVCDRAHEDLDGRDWAHWSIPDPVPAGSDRAFDDALEAITTRVARLSAQVVSTTG
jgi:protein-tyrosine-phosphatase/DNA-binding transcriptional ArsR family regulator